jgi:hypothetical protein
MRWHSAGVDRGVGEFGEHGQIDVAVDDVHRRLAHDGLLVALRGEDVEAGQLIRRVLLDQGRSACELVGLP